MALISVPRDARTLDGVNAFLLTIMALRIEDLNLQSHHGYAGEELDLAFAYNPDRTSPVDAPISAPPMGLKPHR